MDAPVSSTKSNGEELRVRTLRRLTTNINSSDLNISLADDESERSSHRKAVAELQNKSNSLNESFKFNGEEEIQDHFQFCTKLHAENRINNKIAWKLRIIDVLREISTRKGPDALVMAGTSLDIGAKVYGVKVDDVYNEGFKLANSLARMDKKQDQSINEENADISGVMNVTDKKEKKKRKRNMNKRTLVKDLKSLLAPLPKIESVAFSVRVDSTEGIVENLLTNKLCSDKSCSKFVLFSESDEKAIPQGAEEALEQLQTIRGFNMNQLPQIVSICRTFRDFVLDDWDPESEEIEKIDVSIDNVLVHDDQGIPVHQLDGPLNTSEFYNDNDDPARDEPEEEIVDFQLRQNIERVTNVMYPEEQSHRSEYSYNSVMYLENGQVVDKVWAGPSHWKLKFLHRAKPKFSVSSEQNVVQKRSRVRKKTLEYLPSVIDDFVDAVKKMEAIGIGNAKKKIISSEDSVTIPPTDSSVMEMMTNMQSSLIAPGEVYPLEMNVVDVDQNNVLENQVDDHHDSSIGAGGFDNDIDVDNDQPLQVSLTDECALAAQHNFLNDNLIDIPQYVPQSQLTYASQAKRMDMKKLKTFTWNIITKNWHPQLNIPTKFSSIFKELKAVLPESMRNELSCGLALNSLLQLANENSLFLENQTGSRDFNVFKNPL